MERGVIVGGVLICVSFLLAVFLNHHSAERRSVAGAAATSRTEVHVVRAAPELQGGGNAECRPVTAAHAPEPTTAALIDQHCPAAAP